MRDTTLVIYYHLKNPLLALAKMRKILKTGGHIIIEGPVLIDEGRPIAKFIYKDFGHDRSNWWVPSTECLQEWGECSRFRILNESYTPMPPYMKTASFKVKQAVKQLIGRHDHYSTRAVVLAEGIAGKDPYYSLPDPELADIMV